MRIEDAPRVQHRAASPATMSLLENALVYIYIYGQTRSRRGSQAESVIMFEETRFFCLNSTKTSLIQIYDSGASLFTFLLPPRSASIQFHLLSNQLSPKQLISNRSKILKKKLPLPPYFPSFSQSFSISLSLVMCTEIEKDVDSLALGIK